MSIIGMDIGGTHLRVGSVTGGEVSGFHKISSGVLAEGNVIENLIRLIEEHLRRQGEDRPDAISIGVPASISADRKSVYNAPNLKNAAGEGYLDHVNVVDPLSAHFGCPVYLSKDVNNLLYCDLVQLGLQDADTVAAGYVGTGFGGALYMRGQLQYGRKSAAMDIGHINLFGNSEKCNCGKTGCAETLASGQRLVKLQKQFFPDTPLEDMFIKHADTPQIQEFLYACAQPFAMLVTILDPDVVLVGGGVAHMPGFPMDQLREMIMASSSKVTGIGGIDVRLAPDMPEKGVLGAAYYAEAMMKKQ